MKYGFWDKEGKPLADVLAWGKLFEDINYRRIAETTLSDGKWVSTVWLGSDHGFGSETDAPLIFETMVFPKKGEWGELDCFRWATVGEALAGHLEVVKKWSKV